MRVCGIIAEYDPFHKGHAHHLACAREKSGADYIICVMSGSFTQRGMPALLPTHTRAEMALKNGADIILQMPYTVSVREAEYFALGGVHILHSLKCVTHLSFGSEWDDLSQLSRAAALLETPDETFDAAVQANLALGLSHAEAVGRALSQQMDITPQTLNAPNTALALSYLRALIRLNSNITPVPILRCADYHAAELEAFPSATAMRGAILRGDWQAIEKGIPECGLDILKKAVLEKQLCPPDGLDALLRQKLLFSSADEIAQYPGISEGLEMRIKKAAESAATREELIRQVKTRRYTHGRINRAFCHMITGVKKAALSPLPDHARILGFKKSVTPLLRIMQKSDFPLITQPARDEKMASDILADEIWRIGARLPLGETYRRPPVIVD